MLSRLTLPGWPRLDSVPLVPRSSGEGCCPDWSCPVGWCSLGEGPCRFSCLRIILMKSPFLYAWEKGCFESHDIWSRLLQAPARACRIVRCLCFILMSRNLPASFCSTLSHNIVCIDFQALVLTALGSVLHAVQLQSMLFTQIFPSQLSVMCASHREPVSASLQWSSTFLWLDKRLNLSQTHHCCCGHFNILRQPELAQATELLVP